MDTPLPIGIIGCGGICDEHLKGCKENGIAKAIAVCDVMKERAEKYSNQYDIDHVYTDYKNLISRDDVEAVVICLPNNMHHEVAIAALKAGKHVLCEKPMSYRTDWAQNMVDAANEAGKIIQIAMVSRFRPETQWLHKKVLAGDFGKVYYGRAHYIRRSGIPGWGSWFTRKITAGGGPLIDVGVHGLDLIWYLMGKPQPISVYGVTYAELGPHKKGLGGWGVPVWDGYFDVEDFAAALIRFANGATISLEASWAGYSPSSGIIQLMGTEKGATLLSGKVNVMTQEDGQNIDTTVYIPDQGNAKHESLFAAQMRSFVEAIRGQAPCMVPAEEGLVMTKMLASIYESAQTGSDVKLS